MQRASQARTPRLTQRTGTAQDGSFTCALGGRSNQSRGISAVKRTILVATVGLFALLAQAGSAQAPTTTTLTFYEPSSGGNFKVIDNAPKSPTKNLQSRRYRFSVGDKIVFSQRLLTGPGGQRVGTLYADLTVVKGKTFNSI